MIESAAIALGPQITKANHRTLSVADLNAQLLKLQQRANGSRQ